MSVNEIKNIDEFKKEINNKKLILVDFFANWCGPCKMIDPIIGELKKTRIDVSFIKVNVDILQELANNYKILSLPTLIVFKNGNELKRKTGFLTYDEIEKYLLN